MRVCLKCQRESEADRGQGDENQNTTRVARLSQHLNEETHDRSKIRSPDFREKSQSWPLAWNSGIPSRALPIQRTLQVYLELRTPVIHVVQ